MFGKYNYKRAALTMLHSKNQIPSERHYNKTAHSVMSNEPHKVDTISQ